MITAGFAVCTETRFACGGEPSTEEFEFGNERNGGDEDDPAGPVDSCDPNDLSDPCDLSDLSDPCDSDRTGTAASVFGAPATDSSVGLTGEAGRDCCPQDEWLDSAKRNSAKPDTPVR